MMGTPSIAAPRNPILGSFLNPTGGAVGSSGPSTGALLTGLNRAYKNGETAIWLHNSSLIKFTRPESDEGDETGPGVKELANRVWEHARRRAEDQIVVVSGIAGSGKSKAIESMIAQITTLASAVPSSQTTTVELTAILNASMTVLTSLTSAATPSNAYTSFHAGLNVTLALDIYGAIASAKISTPYVDASRLTDLPSQSGHRTFGAFYQLLRGATPQEQSYLSLLKPEQYEYLRKSGTWDLPSGLNIDDAASADDFREALRACGFKGKNQRGIYQVLAACLLLGNLKFSPLEGITNIDVLEDACTLLDIDPDALGRQIISTRTRDAFVQDVYRLLVEWIVNFINSQLMGGGNSEIGAQVSIVEIPSPSGGQNGYGAFVRAWIAETLELQLQQESFDDTVGLNAEMIADAVALLKVNADNNSECVELLDKVASASNTLSSIESLTDKLSDHMFSPCYKSDSPSTFSIRHTFNLGDWIQYDSSAGFADRNILATIIPAIQSDSFLKELLTVQPTLDRTLLKPKIDALCESMQNARIWTVFHLKPTSSTTFDPSAWDVSLASSQVRTFHLAQHHARRKSADFTTDFTLAEFYDRYASIFPQNMDVRNLPPRDCCLHFLDGRKLPIGEYFVGNERVWIGELGWENLEGELDDCIAGVRGSEEMLNAPDMYSPGTPMTINDGVSGYGFYAGGAGVAGSREGLLDHISERYPRQLDPNDRSYYYGMDDKDHLRYEGDIEARNVEVVGTTLTRKLWVLIVWLVTWPFPPFLLNWVGRMKRKDVQMAWREKVTICFFIFLLCGTIIFYIIFFQRLICPEFDKVWNAKETSEHQGDNDFFVSVRGKVYDISSFWRLDHSDSTVHTSSSNMQQFAGKDLTAYFPYPLTQACSALVSDQSIQLIINMTEIVDSSAIHYSGPAVQGDSNSALYDITWYRQVFLPKIKQYYKGALVVEKDDLKLQGQEGRQWAVIDSAVYDLSDYFNTVNTYAGANQFQFLDESVSGLFQGNPGTDVSAAWNALSIDATTRANNLDCLRNLFFVGSTDVRETARCQVNNYILLVFTIMICATILVKFLAALQLGTKRSPARQDKYVICQVPAYTEGEDQLRKALDSLTFLNYDDKKKLLFVICDGTITGAGNAGVPTHRIVLDILGSDPKIDPPAFAFKSVSEGMDQLNYAKVYSGLYEYEGHVVPYIVVHKCGRPGEVKKPGNRGKRDSQVLLLNFLSRCYYQSAMTPLELEIYHQIANVIGINPQMYEYLLTVDADTEVTEDSLNRLVACCANDSKIIGICGETSLQNEEGSWWTMIQVYEYYISHALAKAFESLFGTVTCLPGCFSLYRLKTLNTSKSKGKPYLVHPDIINEYADNKVDTLHKKNLLHLGEDRYLTTLMTKHFPRMKTAFTPDAIAKTAAPDTWNILISQRRRWINSTVHNLMELVLLNDMCGFCCFSMRFVVFIDLFGTLILPATVIYLGYLIYMVATGSGQFPLIAIIMLAAIYGLQAIIFILKRRWQHIGWMIVYLIAYPVYGFALPVYSFWHMDDFAWGNTRVVVGEKGGKKIIASAEDEKFSDSIIPMKRWEHHAQEKNLPLGPRVEVADTGSVFADMYAAPTTISQWQQGARTSYMPPQSQVGGTPFIGSQYAPSVTGTRQNWAPRTEMMEMDEFTNGRQMSMAQSQINVPSRLPRGSFAMSTHSRYAGSEVGYLPPMGSRPQTMGNEFADFDSNARGSDDSLAMEVVRNVLKEVDINTTTTKQVRALVESKLGLGLHGPVSPEQRKALDDMIDKELEAMI